MVRYMVMRRVLHRSVPPVERPRHVVPGMTRHVVYENFIQAPFPFVERHQPRIWGGSLLSD
ncbi:hypothetical protein RvY_17516 [Ramazzottius varieornatus]|uniref:Uncharacterized protein n=1 Tax=Ramazzottius varieornatus TaxID=947166 RepID=A0A1D1W2E5_RAMVA|nr:hypothetical protein RvY_17516 [Ramazzottius varieornatus]